MAESKSCGCNKAQVSRLMYERLSIVVRDQSTRCERGKPPSITNLTARLKILLLSHDLLGDDAFHFLNRRML